MMQELVDMYENGAITADHLVVESLHKLNPAAPALVLAALPQGVLERMLAYAESYRPGAMRTNYGLPPAPDQVAAARQWIEANLTAANGDHGILPRPDRAERH
ncbi:MAG TPA: hypothetical protein VNH11_17665 [Pirellulales bacterium]|nr:hypothetical protein [Pirellulales bacterium]